MSVRRRVPPRIAVRSAPPDRLRVGRLPVLGLSVPRPAVRRRLRVLRRCPRRGPLPPARHRWRLFGPRLIPARPSRLRWVPLRRGRDRVLVVPVGPGSWHPRRTGVIPPAGCVVLVAVRRLRVRPGTGGPRAIAGVLPPFAVVHGCVSCPFRYRIAIPRTAQPAPRGAVGVALDGGRFRPTFFLHTVGMVSAQLTCPPQAAARAVSTTWRTGCAHREWRCPQRCPEAHPPGRLEGRPFRPYRARTQSRHTLTVASRAIGDHKVSYPGSVMGGGSSVLVSGGA
jgi:hypothetical protein